MCRLKNRIIISFMICSTFMLLAIPRSWAADSLKFGILPVVDTLPLIAGIEEGHFEDQGIMLELIPFQSALERDAALQAGKLDGYFGDILNTVLLIHAGSDIKILTTAFHTHPEHRMFGIAASPKSGIDNIDQLKGKQVAISRATIIEYLLDQMLLKNGKPLDAVEKLEIKKMPLRLQMLLSDGVTAALLPEPLLSLAEMKGAKVLLDDRTLDTAETVLAISNRHLSADTTLAVRFTSAYRNAVASINRNPESYKTMLVERTRFPMPAKDKYRIPVFPPVEVPVAGDIANAQHWLKTNKMVTTTLAYENIVVVVAPATP
ncbi:MAG: ABC transporter substrate-binding protein [Desulfobacteraceae bacterium]|nr:ABC transporter substrate-binding protein [Desulfobacteraceae bacterium]